MNETRKPFWIGVFLLSGLVLLVGGILILARDSLWSKPVEYVVYFTGALDGLDVGADVTYRGVKVGSVRDIRLSYDRKINDVIMPVVIRISTDVGNKPSTGPQLDKAIARLAERGLRAQLQVPSLLTGKAIVALDFFPGQDGYVRDDGEESTGLTAIPTVPSRLDQAADVLRDLADGLRSVPLKETLESANRTLERMESLLASPELGSSVSRFNELLGSLNQISRQLDRRLPGFMDNLDDSGRELKQALADVRKAADSARQTLEDASVLVQEGQRSLSPQSELQYELLQALQNISSASKSLQRTAQAIEQQPQSLIFGKKQ